MHLLTEPINPYSTFKVILLVFEKLFPLGKKKKKNKDYVHAQSYP